MKKNVTILVILLLVLTAGLFGLKSLRFEGFHQRASYPPVNLPGFIPSAYWQFDGPLPQTQTNGPSTFGTNISTDYIVKTGGKVGKYISVDNDHRGFPIGNMPAINGAFTLEMVWRPTNLRQSGIVFDVYDTTVSGKFPFKFETNFQTNSGGNTDPYFKLTVETNLGKKELTIPLDGIGPRSYDWWNTEQHHVAFVVGSGVMQMWVDGTLPPGFSNTVPGLTSLYGNGGLICFNSRSQAVTSCEKNYPYILTRGEFDEVAFYNSKIPDNLIAEHAQNVQDGLHYSPITSLPSVPTPPPTDTNVRDMEQYLPNIIVSQLGVTAQCNDGIDNDGDGKYDYWFDNTVTPPVYMGDPDCTSINDTSEYAYTTYTANPPGAVELLQTAQLPRYMPGETMKDIINANDLQYQAHNNPNDYVGNIDNSPSLYRLAISEALNLELAQNWGHSLYLGHITSGEENYAGEINNNVSNPKSYVYRWIAQANAHPELSTYVSSAHAQIGRSLTGIQVCPDVAYLPTLVGGPCIDYQGFPEDHYLRKLPGGTGTIADRLNSGGGTYNPSSNAPVRRPLASNILDYKPDGDRIAKGMNTLLGALNRPSPEISLWFEDGEESQLITPTAMDLDPDVTSARIASGLTQLQYIAEDYKNYENISYVDPVMALPGMQNTPVVFFRVDGYPDAGSLQFEYARARDVLRPFSDGNTYAGPRVYPSRPSYILNSIAQYSGLWYLKQAIQDQQKAGDKFFMAQTANGWDPLIENNIPPGEWLGTLKDIMAKGSEFILDSYFYLYGANKIGWPGTNEYVNQTSAYAQAPLTHVESFYHNSNVVKCDEPSNYALSYAAFPDPNKTYTCMSDSPMKQVSVRKGNGNQKYLISASLLSYDDYNRVGAVRSIAPAPFKISGAGVPGALSNTEIIVDSRPQGAYYFFDNTNPLAPIFYQLDKWQENKHPFYWSKDFAVEAEVNDTGTPVLHTEGPAVTSHDFSNGNYDTSVTLASGSSVGYNFTPRKYGTPGNQTFYLWLRAHGTAGGETAQVKVDGGAPKTISTATSSLQWCNQDSLGAPIAFTVSENTQHTFTFTSQNANFYFDQFILTKDPSPNFKTSGCLVPPNSPPVVTITSPTSSINYNSLVSTINLGGTATDSDGTITPPVTWKNYLTGDTGTATGTNAWTITNIPLANGVNSIEVQATDDDLGVGIDTINVTYSVDTTPPTITFDSPHTGQLTGTVNLVATASDASGIDHVEFYAKPAVGPAILLAGTQNVSSNTYTLAWNSATLTNAFYDFYAIAYDSATPTENSAQSAPLYNLEVYNIVLVVDTTKPIVSWNTPLTGDTISGIANLNVTASDPPPNQTGVSYVAFSYKKVGTPSFTAIGNSTGSGGVYQYAWSTFGKSGYYTLRAQAFDGAMPTPNNAIDDIINIYINNATLLPDLVITGLSWTPATPLVNDSVVFTATVQNTGAAATPSTNVRVAFAVDGTLVAISDNQIQSIAAGQTVTLSSTLSPWLATVGTHTILANVDDINSITESNEANNQSSSTMTVTATTNISIVYPTTGTVVPRGTSLVFKVLTSGPIKFVRYYRGGIARCTADVTAPDFSCQWNVSAFSFPGSTTTWYVEGLDINGNVIATSSTVDVIRGN